MTDGYYCQGNASTGFDCDVSAIGKANLDTLVVVTDESNTYGAFTQDFSAGIIDIESGAAGVTAAEGELAIDTSNEGQFVFHDDGGARYLSAEIEKCKTIESLDAGDDGVPLWSFRRAATIISSVCYDNSAATPTVTLSGTTAGTLDSPTCSGTPTYDTTLTATAITAGDRITLDTGDAATADSWVMICVTYIETAQ